MGLAIGDALGQATKGLKPEAIKQLYKRMDKFQDVRPFIGKGVKTYRMKGLYGCQMQMGLALGESLIRNKGLDEAAFGELLVRMSLAGPEGYFGVFRRPEGVFARSVMEFTNRMDPTEADWNTSFGSFFPLGVATALFYGRDSATFKEAVTRVGTMMSSHPWEISATAVSGFIALALCRKNVKESVSVLNDAKTLLEESASWVEQVEQTCSVLEKESGPVDALSKTLTEMAKRVESSSAEELQDWILENANQYLKQPLRYTTQGQALVLLPQALLQVLRSPDSFDGVMERTGSMGREAVKLCALTGAFAGALFGANAIGQEFMAGLVNVKEIKSRGEALTRRRFSGKGKDLVDMEMGLTRKEAEENRKYVPKTPRKPATDQPVSKHQLFEEMGVEWEHDPLMEIRDNPRLRREFEREKSKKKKERRQRLK
ncbi:MAG: ADP-ribosylglycohydrolase family protein [Candidatus Nitronauta litoralis]|uniref:ADP-ribosylglycohydrolase family protein n=1 Tax=Candidatus Nitronauta litoralis TaxID=2705533 RepID=A0A7T0BW32_9BACT|nr:MAG: ADP-ribosylglycohydrolase family protein [Candidatus Nitronauta litoralis]